MTDFSETCEVFPPKTVKALALGELCICKAFILGMENKRQGYFLDVELYVPGECPAEFMGRAAGKPHQPK